MRLQNNKLLPPFALMMLIVSVLFCIAATTAYAAESPTIAEESLSVDEVWLTGDVLHIAVTDKNSGEKQTLELNLSDYAKPGDEYVSVQATDAAGNISNIIQFKNPYYVPAEEQTGDGTTENQTSDGTVSESAVPNGENAFTPDGTGSVVDNATDGDGKEFFTVETTDGNVYYLIVDRQRNAENVYFLNSVTEDDLKSLAKTDDDAPSESAIPTPSVPVVTTPTPEQPTIEPALAPAEKSGNMGTIALVLVAVVLVGGAGYYFKIVRPKKNAAEDFDDGYEPDDDEEMPLGGNDEEVDEE
jgi:hypothetical protein